MTSADVHSHDSSIHGVYGAHGSPWSDAAHDYGARGAGDDFDLIDGPDPFEQVDDDVFDDEEGMDSEVGGVALDDDDEEEVVPGNFYGLDEEEL